MRRPLPRPCHMRAARSGGLRDGLGLARLVRVRVRHRVRVRVRDRVRVRVRVSATALVEPELVPATLVTLWTTAGSEDHVYS